MRVLACAGRKFRDKRTVERLFSQVEGENHTLVVADDSEADQMLYEVARRLGWHATKHPADYRRNGLQAVYVRNREMLEVLPERAIVFHGDASTEDLKMLCKRASVVVYEVGP